MEEKLVSTLNIKMIKEILEETGWTKEQLLEEILRTEKIINEEKNNNKKKLRLVLKKEKEKAESSKERDEKAMKGKLFLDGGWSSFLPKSAKDISYNSSTNSMGDFGYDNFFKYIFPKDIDSFSEVVDKIIEKNGKVNIMDLFGPGFFQDDFSTMTSVMTTDPRDIERENNERIRAVSCNIISHNFSKEVDKNMKNGNIKGYELIVCKPGQPFYFRDRKNKELDSFYTENSEYYLIHLYNLLRKTYSFLSENGQIYLSIPTVSIYLDDYSEKLNNLKKMLNEKNILCEISDMNPETVSLCIRIEKKEGAPSTIPKISELGDLFEVGL